MGTKQDEFDMASQMAQGFSGALFSALVAYLIFSNSTRLSYIQRASLEKRLNVACQINTIVASLSAFLNFFQLTEVDNWFLPGSRDFTVDVARPIEWILTCPLMQLNLVLMGGCRIPEYRLFAMPASSAVVLFIGGLTLFAEAPTTFILYFIALIVHGIAMYFNRKQIIEHSNGVEGFFSGDSEFRKATLVLMLTWLPFPAWYILSPEGSGLVTDVTLIQLGWAFLNITAKFTSIFYMQRIKDNYCNRLKVKREMKGALANAANQEYGEDDEDQFGDKVQRINGDLSACVVETMNYLGMAENVERFLRLLQEAHICSLEQVGQLNREDAKLLQLPFDLVSALQKRHKVWALEMVDDAEKGLEDGEKHYKKAAPKFKCHTPLGSYDRQISGDSNWQRQASLDAVGQSVIVPLASQVVPLASQIVPLAAQVVPLQQVVPQVVPIKGSGNHTMLSASPISTISDGLIYENNGPAADAFVNSNADAMLQKNGYAFDGTSNQICGKNPYARQESGSTLESLRVAPLDLEPLEKKIDGLGKTLEGRLEGMLLEKFESILEGVGKQLEKVSDNLGSQLEKVSENFGSGLQDVRNSCERSQTLLEAKVEYVFSSQNKENRQNVQADMQAQLEQLAAHLNQHAAASHDANAGSMKAVQNSLNSLAERLESMETVQKSASLNMGGSIAEMADGWAHQVIQETKAAAYTLQMKLSVMEEMQSKKQEAFEQKITSKIQQVVSDGVESINGVVAQRAESSAEQVQDSIERSFKAVSLQEQAKLDEKLSQMLKDVSQDCTKSVEVGVGVFGNSLRSQLESMQAVQLAQRMELENHITTRMESKLDGLLARMQEQTTLQTQKQSDKITSMLETNIKESAEKSTRVQTDELKDFQKYVQTASQSQQEHAMEMHSVIASVNDDTRECVDRLAALCAHCELRDPGAARSSSPQSPQPLRPSTAGAGGGRFKQTSKYSNS